MEIEFECDTYGNIMVFISFGRTYVHTYINLENKTIFAIIIALSFTMSPLMYFGIDFVSNKNTFKVFEMFQN